MKKILSLVLAIMMVLSMANVAFAAPEDVTDKNQQKAVDALMSLGIVKGYEDGSYKPEKTVTRAEMAKLLVEAKGQGAFAQGSESSFKDAKGTWYDGYVAMAAGLELVKGYPDGTFKGDKSVSYQEAVVMIIRALGYTDATVNGGVSAYNESKYKALAATLGLLNNVTFKNSGANRGDVASMLYNALDVDYVETNDKGKAEKVVLYNENEPIAGTDKSKSTPVYKKLIDFIANVEEITIKPANMDPNSSDYLGKNVDVTPYMYQTVKAYFNDAHELLSVKKVLSNVVVGSNATYRNDDIRHEWGKLQFKTTDGTIKKVYTKLETNSDGTVKGDYDITVFLNGEETTVKASYLQSISYSYRTAKATFILDKNNFVEKAIMRVGGYTSRITEKYRTNELVVKGQDDDRASNPIYLPKNAAKVDLSKVTVTGAVTSIEDIAKNDIVTVYVTGAANGSANYAAKRLAPSQVELVVSRDTIEGVITEHSAGGRYAVINGETYNYTGNVYKNVNAGSEGIFFLSASGAIYSFDGKSINNNEYALIVDSNNGYVPSQVVVDAYITIFNKESKITKYNFAKDAMFSLNGSKTENTVWDNYNNRTLVSTVLNAKNMSNGMVVTGFNLDSNGRITKIELTTLAKQTGAVKVDSKTFVLSNDVVMYNAYLDNGDLKFAVMSADKLRNEDANSSGNGYYFDTNKAGEICAVVYTQKLEMSDYILVTDIYNVYNNGKVVQKVHGFVNGEEVTYLTTNKDVMDEDYCWDTLVELKVNSSGEIVSFHHDDQSVPDSVDTVFNRTTTSGSAITVNLEKNTFAVGSNRFALAKEGSIYVLNRTNLNGLDTAVQGTLSDLSRTDVDVYMYNLDTKNGDGIIEVIVVIQRPLTK